MKMISEFMHSSIMFWMAWVIIPIIMEIIPTIFDFFILLKRKIFNKKKEELAYKPEITLIIPVYNSADTLYDCIKSVNDSNYDNKLIYIMLVNNQTQDNSFEVFTKCQKDFPSLTINWVDAEQGKSKALNLALFNSYGKYILHIDSDGMLHPDAIYNIISKFESNDDIDCLTGTIMTDPKAIDATKGFGRRLLRKLEFFEYCQAFLAGRNFQSEFNSIFTLSGAFSAFRKSSILKSQLYNTDTVCEDTHVTFQIREAMGDKVVLCDNAFFFVNPISGVNELYTQRQRWQRGEIEVMHMFAKKSSKKHKAKRRNYISDFTMRLLMYDHTFAFPRMIWYFALICLAFINYPVILILKSVVIMYILYVIATIMLYFCIVLFLSKEKTLRNYYVRKWYLVFLLPLFNFLVFWFRLAGIINSVKGEQSWKVKNLTEEKNEFFHIIYKDYSKVETVINKWRMEVNEQDD